MLILTLGAECDNFTIFALSKVIALLLFYMNHKIIIKYTRLYEQVSNEKRDMTPTRELIIRKDKIGEYVIHNHKRYYID